MKTQQAIDLAGSTKELADLLEITSGAISQWGEDVPDSRIWQLRVLKPNWFTPNDSDTQKRGDEPRDRRGKQTTRRVSVRSVAEEAAKLGKTAKRK